MKQHNQIGKRPKKEELLNALKDRVWISPKNREYQFDWSKIGRKYTFILCYKGIRMQLSEVDYVNTPIDQLIDAMETEIVKFNLI